MSSERRIFIKWSIDNEGPIEGVSGIDYETVRVDDLVRWARRRRKQLRRATQPTAPVSDVAASEEGS